MLAAGTATNGPDGTSSTISGNNYLVGFDLNGGQGTAPSTEHVLVLTLQAMSLTLPTLSTVTPPTGDGPFIGW